MAFFDSVAFFYQKTIPTVNTAIGWFLCEVVCLYHYKKIVFAFCYYFDLRNTMKVYCFYMGLIIYEF